MSIRRGIFKKHFAVYQTAVPRSFAALKDDVIAYALPNYPLTTKIFSPQKDLCEPFSTPQKI
jgi:hypothetical protein